MSKIPVYLIPAPIGSYLSEMSLASIQIIQKTRYLFIESNGRFIHNLRKKGYIQEAHQLIEMGEENIAIAERLIQQRRPFALLADTGNPCFVDPGYDIVSMILDRYLDSVELVPIGMSSALDAALSMAGVDIQRFIFCGHYPENYMSFSELSRGYPLVFYVAGRAVVDWVMEIQESIDPSVITLYRNIRDRSGGQIYRIRRGGSGELDIQNNLQDNYVSVVVF